MQLKHGTWILVPIPVYVCVGGGGGGWPIQSPSNTGTPAGYPIWLNSDTVCGDSIRLHRLSVLLDCSPFPALSDTEWQVQVLLTNWLCIEGSHDLLIGSNSFARVAQRTQRNMSLTKLLVWCKRMWFRKESNERDGPVCGQRVHPVRVLPSWCQYPQLWHAHQTGHAPDPIFLVLMGLHYTSVIDYMSLSKLMSIKSVTPSNHLILCRPLLLLPSIFPSIRVFSKVFSHQVAKVLEPHDQHQSFQWTFRTDFL